MAPTQYNEHPKDVVIVGAGVAGMSAASVFDAAGWRVLLLDKAKRPGGRCATRRVTADADSRWFDYGAQYFTARDSAFRAIVEADLAAARLRCWQPAICVAERGGDGWQLAASADERERLVAPGGLNYWVRDTLAGSGAELRCNATVEALEAVGDGWRVTLAATDAPIHADAVVLTPPAVQSAALLGAKAKTVAVLDRASQALRACHSLVVEAPALADCHGAFVKSGCLSWFADNSHKAGDNDAALHLWSLHATPEYSDANLEADARSVEADLADEFAAIAGIDRSRVRPVHTHRWRYARPGDAAPNPDNDCWIDRSRQLALAGDWLAGGRIEGAWLSGRAAALGLLDRSG